SYYTYPIGFMTALQVFEPITRETRLNFFTFQGSDPDNPGTELMAYLDNHSLEELYDLIHFLRSSYKEDHAFYIFMAQEAMQRKSGFLTWPVLQEEDERRKSEPLYIYPSWALLNDVESIHKNKYAYSFSNVWREVKASSSRNKQFNVDLFESGNYPFHLKYWKKSWSRIHRKLIPTSWSRIPITLMVYLIHQMNSSKKKWYLKLIIT